MEEKRNTDRNMRSAAARTAYDGCFSSPPSAKHTLNSHTQINTHTPVLHASVFPRRLFERDVARGEGAEAAGDDGHGAELGPGLVDHVGAGGVLLAVLAIPPLQVVVRAGDGHLHGCSFQSAGAQKVRTGQTELAQWALRKSLDSRLLLFKSLGSGSSVFFLFLSSALHFT